MPIRTDLDMPDPDEDPVSYNVDAVRAQEHNGASYHLKHMRSAPMAEQGYTNDQGRLYRSAVPRTDERVGEVPQGFTQTPNGETLQYADPPSYLSDAVAMHMRVDPGQHPVNFARGYGQSNAGQAPNPAPGNTTANGRTIYGGPHRTDQRY